MNKEMLIKLKTLTVLYAEDEKDIRIHITDTLRYYVKEVIEAVNGKEAYRLYKEKKPDVILSDILMPELDGYGVLQIMMRTKELQKTPFIFMTLLL